MNPSTCGATTVITGLARPRAPRRPSRSRAPCRSKAAPRCLRAHADRDTERPRVRLAARPHRRDRACLGQRRPAQRRRHAAAGSLDQPGCRERPGSLHRRELGAGTNNPVTCPAASVVGSAELALAAAADAAQRTRSTSASRSAQTLNPAKSTGCSWPPKDPTYGISVRLVGAALGERGDRPPDRDLREHAANAVHGNEALVQRRRTRRAGEPGSVRHATTSSTLQSRAPGTAATPIERVHRGRERRGRRVPVDAAPFAPALSGVPDHGAPARSTAHARLRKRRPRAEARLDHAQLPPGSARRALRRADVRRTGCAAQGSCGARKPHRQRDCDAGARHEPAPALRQRLSDGPLRRRPRSGSRSSFPRVAGPYNLGTVVVRARYRRRPQRRTPHDHERSALPTMLAGVPLRLQRLALAIERAGFMVNPTSCASRLACRHGALEHRFEPARLAPVPEHQAAVRCPSNRPPGIHRERGLARRRAPADSNCPIRANTRRTSRPSRSRCPSQLVARVSHARQGMRRIHLRRQPRVVPGWRTRRRSERPTPVLPGTHERAGLPRAQPAAPRSRSSTSCPERRRRDAQPARPDEHHLGDHERHLQRASRRADQEASRSTLPARAGLAARREREPLRQRRSRCQPRSCAERRADRREHDDRGAACAAGASSPGDAAAPVRPRRSEPSRSRPATSPQQRRAPASPARHAHADARWQGQRRSVTVSLAPRAPASVELPARTEDRRPTPRASASGR